MLIMCKTIWNGKKKCHYFLINFNEYLPQEYKTDQNTHQSQIPITKRKQNKKEQP